MHISDFDYDLPLKNIAQEPVYPRDASRMMVLDGRTGSIVDSQFNQIARFLQPSDILVLNDTRVVRARTSAQLERKSGTSRKIEVFFVEPISGNIWRVLCRPGRRIRPGDRAIFGNGKLEGIFHETDEAGLHVLQLITEESALEILDRFGEIPLPPYLNRPATPKDTEDYQTIFASSPGAVAAPTAGLHFTESTLQSLQHRGIEIVRITLHTGVGTFLPLRTDNPREHVLHPERFEISASAAQSLRRAIKTGKRVVAVGTTTTRALEYLMQAYGEIRSGADVTSLYILPGFQFRIVGALLTNFHLPRSTLLMLVSAFAGRERILAAYNHAIVQNYRFYSYGDCMLIDPGI